MKYGPIVLVIFLVPPTAPSSCGISDDSKLSVLGCSLFSARVPSPAACSLLVFGENSCNSMTPPDLQCFQSVIICILVRTTAFNILLKLDVYIENSKRPRILS